MKRKIFSILIALVLVLSFSLSSVASAAKPVTFDVSYHQTQFQWRAKFAGLGDWTDILRNSHQSSEFKLTGNVLHSAYSYSPIVDDLEGESTVYVYDKESGFWIEKEGRVSYKYEPLYGDYPIVNHWRGYLEFDGTPSEDSFVHGVAYQWVYLLAPQEPAPSYPPHATWDNTMDAWLVGFSVYLWDGEAQDYELEFPDLFTMKPVPASNYNPLDL